MANKFVTAIFGDYSKKEVKKVKKTADKVLALEEKYASMSDRSLHHKPIFLKAGLQTVKHLMIFYLMHLLFAVKVRGVFSE